MSFRQQNNNRTRGRHGFSKRGRGGRNFNNSYGNKTQNSHYRHQNQLSEKEVGISQYMSKLEGYSAIIKARFSDFHVNEIDMNGKLVKISDTKAPTDLNIVATCSYKDTEGSPLDKIPQDTWDALKVLVEGSDNALVELDAEHFTKDDRTSVHKCVKSYFGSEIVASTVTLEGKTKMKFTKGDKTKKDERVAWPKDLPEFVYFVLYKEMMDSMEATLKMAHTLKMSPTKITYAGVKDKRAKTSQWCCIKKYDPSKLIFNTKRIKNLKIGNFEFKDKPLKIGQLKGNKFRIALRNAMADDELIKNSLEHVREHGFINYYGLQRFGNSKEAPTFLVGIKLLKGEWKEAVSLILKVKDDEDPTLCTNNAKKVYAETGDAAAAVKICGKWSNCLEKKLLEGLANNHENDYVNALENVPRTMRLMYLHSFQSLIWNKMVSKRVEEFGFAPVEGDLVYVDDNPMEVIIDDEDSEDDAAAETNNTSSVKTLTANELNKYTIFDIVLPLPGYDVVYPDNLKQHYKEAIEEYGLTMEMPKQKVRTYNLSGTYRKMVQRLNDLEWKIMYYNDPTDNLIRSDLEELNGEEEPKSIENGKFKAVIMSFTLNPSSYATMVIREVLKRETATSIQAGLNNYWEKPLDKPKVILDDSNEVNVQDDIVEEAPQGSLLADKARYEDFKDSLFKDILQGDGETSSKRKLEDDNDEDNSKKLKTD